MKKTVIKGIAWFAILALVFTSLALFAGCGLREKTSNAKVTLTIWGTYDNSDDIAPIIRAFRDLKGMKGLSIEYKKIPMERIDALQDGDFDSTYEELLFSEIASGQGPDIFMAHNSWFPKHTDKMIPLLSDKASIDTYLNAYVPTISRDLVVDGSLYAVPLYVDNLALYYNPKYFLNTPSGAPATTWDNFINEIPDVEILDGSDSVTAIALGTTSNISRASDIVLNLALQAGYTPARDLSPLELAGLKPNPLQFYTQFSDPTENAYSWDDTRDYYIDEFVDGNVASIVGYRYLDTEIQTKAGFGFDYKVAPLPQMDLRNPVVYANYWAPAISINSQHPDLAFEFLQYFSGQAVGTYLDATGHPPARFDHIELLQNIDNINVFARQSKIAQSFPTWSASRLEGAIVNAVSNVYNGDLPRLEISRIDATITAFLRELANIAGIEMK